MLNNLSLDTSFIKELVADPITSNNPRQVNKAHFSFVNPTKTANPKLVAASTEVANLLGINENKISTDEFLQIFSGNKIIEDSKPFAMCYGGHQFGHWAGQLGDGRAINLGELVHNDLRWAIQLKGSGRTPYSRTADGLAVLRSSIREYLCSEAMHHLGVPTTRALSLSLSGDQVLRDMLYDGNPAYEKGAIVCRVAPSFIRFGNFEIFTAREDFENLKKLADYTIHHYYSEFENSETKYLDFYKEVASRTLEMIIHWQGVGFVHGVMNTDNLSILGLTIDYGPYGWQDNFDPNWTPNTTDNQNKRYRFGNQPQIAIWNLVRLANALYPLINETKPLEDVLEQWKTDYKTKYFDRMRSKLGLEIKEKEDIGLITDLEENLQLVETDMTIFYRLLANFDSSPDGFTCIQDAFYSPETINELIKNQWMDWFKAYENRLKRENKSSVERILSMNAVNPKYVLRNYMAQLAIDAAEKENYSVLLELEELLKNPYSEQEESNKWFSKRPDWARTKVGCSALSCSS